MEVVRAGQNVRIASLSCPQKLRALILSGNIVDSLQQVKVVARGKVSDVILVSDIVTGQRYIIKRYYKARLSKLRSFQCIREVKLHCALSHPNIVTIYGAFEDSQTVNLLLEHAPQGDLYKAIMGKGAAEKTAARCVAHICDALMYLHERNVIHRDIKLENVLSCETGYKLADFGLSINAADERPVTKLGTGEYMSPEVLRCLTKNDPSDHKDREDLKYGPEVDIWALGVLSFELLTGHSPFKSQETSAMLQDMERGPVFPPHVPTDAAAFVRDALTLDPVARPSAQDLLNHPWIRKFNFNKTTTRVTAATSSRDILQRRGSIGPTSAAPPTGTAPQAFVTSTHPHALPSPAIPSPSSPPNGPEGSLLGAGAAAVSTPAAVNAASHATTNSTNSNTSRARSFSHIRFGANATLQKMPSVGPVGPVASGSAAAAHGGSLPHLAKKSVQMAPSPGPKDGQATSPSSSFTSQTNEVASQLKNASLGFRERAKMFRSAELTYVSSLDMPSPRGGPGGASSPAVNSNTSASARALAARTSNGLHAAPGQGDLGSHAASHPPGPGAQDSALNLTATAPKERMPVVRFK